MSCTPTARPADCGACLQPTQLNSYRASTLRKEASEIATHGGAAAQCMAVPLAAQPACAAGEPRGGDAPRGFCSSLQGVASSHGGAVVESPAAALAGAEPAPSEPPEPPPAGPAAAEQASSSAPCATQAAVAQPCTVSRCSASASLGGWSLDGSHKRLTGYGESLDGCMCQRRQIYIGLPAQQRRRRSPVTVRPSVRAASGGAPRAQGGRGAAAAPARRRRGHPAPG